MNKKWLKTWVFLCVMGCAGALFYVWYTSYASREVMPQVAARENEVTELALNMYFHRGEQNTDIGRKAITAVVFNRMADKAKRWPHTVVGVIQDGHERGKNCDWSWTCDGKDDTPDDAVRYARDRSLALKWLAEYRKGVFVDPTKGATWLLFKENTPPASWPDLQKTGTFGMYSFYRYTHDVSAPTPSVKPGFLRGSPEAVRRAYHVAEKEGLVFAKKWADIKRLALKGAVVKVSEGENHSFAGVSYPYLHPQAHRFLLRLGAQYRHGCGEKLVVTSLMRATTKQPVNASKLSVHPTGIAMDFRIPPARCRRWLEATLLTLEKAGVVEATREYYRPHYHVVLFPTAYKKYVEGKQAEN